MNPVTNAVPLRVENASVQIGRVCILDDVTLDLPAGQVTAIIGPNGAGKSTLLEVAAGQLAPTSGRVLLDGTDLGKVHTRTAARRRAVMPQDTTVAFPFTAGEVIAMGRSPWPTSTAENERIVDEVLHTCDLVGFADREITTLSGGERQRVAFARVIVQATPILGGSIILLDEPTAAMDIAHAEATLALARELASQGGAIGIVVHDLDAAAAYADELVLMDRGRIHTRGSVRAVCTEEILSGVYQTEIEVIEAAGGLRVGPKRERISSRAPRRQAAGH